MKKINFLFILAVVFFSSCKKDLLPEPEKNPNPCERKSFGPGQTEYWLENCEISDTTHILDFKRYVILINSNNLAADIDSKIKSVEGIPNEFVTFPETSKQQGYKVIEIWFHEGIPVGNYFGIINISISRLKNKEGDIEEIILPLKVNLLIETVTP